MHFELHLLENIEDGLFISIVKSIFDDALR